MSGREGRARADGFTLLEVVITGFVFAVIVLGVGQVVLSTYRVAGNLEQGHLVFAQARSFEDTLLSIRFGRPGDAPATAPDLVELLDPDTFPGGVSLSQVRAASPVEFELDGFPVGGTWRIEVTADLNADGDTDDPLEGRDDLLRIDIRHDGRLVLSTFRSAPTAFEEPGEANALFGPPPPADATPRVSDVDRAQGATVTHLGFSALESGSWLGASGPSQPGVRETGAVE